MSTTTAKTTINPNDRIYQGDLFHDIDVIESINRCGKSIEVNQINFPMVICSNQDCDLNSDERDKQKPGNNRNCRLLHLIVAPVFNFNNYLNGNHWGDIFDTEKKQKLGDTSVNKIMNNEDPRFHYLCFDNTCGLPEMIIDFKHFFTVSTEYLYQNLDKRVRTVDALYREKISQRFAYYISRIGLPD